MDEREGTFSDLLEQLDRLEDLLEEMDELGVKSRDEVLALMATINGQVDELEAKPDG